MIVHELFKLKIEYKKGEQKIAPQNTNDSCQFFYVLLQAIKTTCETRGTIGSLLEDI